MSSFITTIEWFFILLNIVLFFGAILLWKKTRGFRPQFFISKKEYPRFSLNVKELEKRWNVIVQKSIISPPQSYTLAIIEADTFVDTLLKRLGFEGEHMADRLEELEEENLSNLDRLKRAHRIRNHLVHTPDFTLSHHEAQEVLEAYQKFLEEIGALSST